MYIENKFISQIKIIRNWYWQLKKKLYPKITIVHLYNEISDYISLCYRRKCNLIILNYTVISMPFFLLGCCVNVIDSHLSDSRYSFIKHLKRVQMLMVFHTCIHIICCYFAFISCFQYQGCVYFRGNFFFLRESECREQDSVKIRD